MKQTPDGWVITEFLPEVPWGGKHNAISCPAGHHFREGRWLHDRQYLNDYAIFWFRKGGSLRSYSFWAADSIWAQFLATGDDGLCRELLPDLIANYGEWETDRRDPDGLFWQIDDRDGMELSIGGSGYRATINSYMYGDAMAIARLVIQDEQAQRIRAGEPAGLLERGKDYNHSTFCDLVITGLVGLRPRSDDVLEINPLVPEGHWDFFCLDNILYHGKMLSIIWDKSGRKYDHGAGLTVLVDGAGVLDLSSGSPATSFASTLALINGAVLRMAS